MQPRAAVVPRHAHAVLGKGATADAIARFENEHRHALHHQLFRRGEPGTTCTDDEHVGYAARSEGLRANRAEHCAGAESLQEAPTIQHGIAAPQILSLSR
jgi:hypothetical protein